MMTRTLFLFAALLTTGAAHATPSMTGMDMSAMPMGKSAATNAINPLAGLTMDQQMALCARLESLKTQGRTLTQQMRGQLKACETMTMGMNQKPAPSGTLDR